MPSLLQAIMTATLVWNGVAEPTPPPTPTATPTLAERFDVLGVQVCVGAIDDAQPCDLRLWSPPRTTAASEPPAPTATASTNTSQSFTQRNTQRFTLFGHTLCLGPSSDPGCDLTLNPKPSESEA